MELILRKRLTGELLRVNGARILCRRSRRLGFVAPYPGQWIFHALVPALSSFLRYNRQPAPARCSLAVGDLLDLNGLELVVHSLEVPPGERMTEPGSSSFCEIEVPGEGRVAIHEDRLLDYDPSSGLRLGAMLDQQDLTTLLTFAAGRWHLHDLNGSSLIRNGKPSGASLALADGDQIRLRNREVRFHLGRARTANAVSPTEAPARTTPDAERPAANERPWWVDCRGGDAPSPRPAVRREPPVRAVPPAPTPERGPVYRKAKDLCQRLLPALGEGGPTFRTKTPSSPGIWGLLRLLRRPSGPAETLERLEFLLSGSPRNRVWLIELCRFLYQQSYLSLSLRVARALCRLCPLDGELMQMLAKLYYQQGHDVHLPALERLTAFAAAAKCTGLARRLRPSDAVLVELQQAIGTEQKLLQAILAEMAACSAPSADPVVALEEVR